MLESLNVILSRVSLVHLNILFLLGLALFGGAVGGRLFQKIRIPQVVGYIVIGIIIGESGLKIVNHDIIKAMEPLSYFALGLIGFMIGAELKKDVLVKYGRQLIMILLYEGLTAFCAVTIFVGIGGTFLTGNWVFGWSLGLLLGAIASATAPAATSEVLREYRTRGPLTRTILGIVALDDALALILFALASSVVSGLRSHNGLDALVVFIKPLYEIILSITIGVGAGFLLSRMLKKYSEKERLLAFCVGTVLLVAGLAIALHVDMLLAVMTLGVIITNSAPRKGRDIFKLLEGFTPPIYVLFFVLVGAKLNIKHMSFSVFVIAFLYLIGTSAGKMLGAKLGAKLAHAAKSVQRYLPFCLFSQAGVAIGLSILASNYFPGEIGNTIVIVITSAVFVLEIFGPALVRYGITGAGEVGLNVTEEDFMHEAKISEIVEKNMPFLYDNAPLGEILNLFSNTNQLYYPVINKDNQLIGIISVDSIKSIFMETDSPELFLAADLKEPVVTTVSLEATLFEGKETLDKYNLECLPVVSKESKFIGLIERRMFNKLVSTKMMDLQRKADSLEKS